MNRILLAAALLFSQFSNAQQADFSGITNGQVICSGANAINLTADNDPSGVFSGPGVTDNGNGTAIFAPSIASAGIHEISYVLEAGFAQVSAGEYHSLGIKSDGSLWAWGYNNVGQLGDGTNTSVNTPTQIGTDIDWTMISTGAYHSLAIKSDGSLWAWGNNLYGQLGDGTNINRNTPTQIGTDTDWATFATGSNHSLAIKSDGSLWAWGYNYYGQLGDGTNTNRNTPTQIGTDTDWKTIQARAHTLAIKSDGSLWAWGTNLYGQLGDGSNTDRNTPTQIGTHTDWTMIATGNVHSLAIKTDNSLWAWGNNNYGQLGDGTTTEKYSPTHIGTDTDWNTISAGKYHSLGIKSDGSLWAWGNNQYGQLGDGTTTDGNTPTQIGTDTNWQKIDASNHTFAIKSDESLWAWGWNQYGQLGDGTTTNKNTPVLILEPIQEIKTISVEDVNTAVTQLDTYTLTADLAGATYQWIDCSNGNTPITGATAQTFTATANGSYAVIIDNGTCTDTSACVVINNLSLNGLDSENINIHPNPTTGITYLSEIGNVQVFDTSGRLVLEQNNTNSIDLSNQESGIYLVKLHSENGIGTARIIKK